MVEGVSYSKVSHWGKDRNECGCDDVMPDLNEPPSRRDNNLYSTGSVKKNILSWNEVAFSCVGWSRRLRFSRKFNVHKERN